jgi:hypothetical protein
VTAGACSRRRRSSPSPSPSPSPAQRSCGLYLLHFDRPYRHARHYLGYAKRAPADYARRVAAGAEYPPHELVLAALGDGVTMRVADVWPGLDRNDRRELRAGHDRRRLCPICLAEPVDGSAPVD